MKGHKVLEMEYAEGTTASAAATPAQRINAMAKFKEALSDKYPEAIGTYGLRITGGKLEHGGDPWQYIPLKEGWSRKSLRELHMSDRMKIDNPEQLRSFMEYYDRTRPIGRSR
jgi:hypothetical protein